MYSVRCFTFLFLIYMLIRRISTDMRILVTADQCGRSVELDPHSTVFLEYTGADVGGYFSPCVIDFINNNDDDMICIKTDSTNYFDINCHMVLKYYVGGYLDRNYLTKDYTCFDFSSRPLCDRNTRSSVVYRSSFAYKNETTEVWLYTQKYIPTTTRRVTQPPWSSWSSWSSDSHDYDKNDTSTTGVAVGVTVGIVAFIVLLLLCIKACSKQPTPKPQYGPPAVVQFSPQAQGLNQYGNQPQNPSTQQYPPNTTGSNLQTQYTSDASQFRGYQIHAPVYQQVPHQGLAAGNQPEQNYTPQPSAPANIEDPPPPYPGY